MRAGVELLRVNIPKEKEPLQDHCGIIGSIGAHDYLFLQTGVPGLKLLETRGHDGAGIVAINSMGSIVLHHKGVGKVSEVFTDEFVNENRRTPAQMWILQTRYETNGDRNTPEASVQPVVREHKETGDIIVVSHNGEFWTDSDDRNKPESDTVRFTDRLAESKGDDWTERITTTLQKEKGAFSLIMGTPEGMFLARDAEGTRPLSYGRYFDEIAGDYVWIAASETSALSRMGVSEFIEVMPGELIHIAKDRSPRTMKILSTEKSGLCAFEPVYLARAGSAVHAPRTDSKDINYAPSTGEVRRKTGAIMAHEAPLTTDDVDFIVGIPGTAIAGGKGFAEACGIPYQQSIADHDPHINTRRFMTPDISTIADTVLGDLEFDVKELRGQVVGVIDDSYVRGNVLGQVANHLINVCGVAGLHLRILCPPIVNTCNKGLNTRDAEELAAATALMEIGEGTSDVVLAEYIIQKLRESVGKDAKEKHGMNDAQIEENMARILSFDYLSLEGLKEGITGNPHDERLCTECMRDTVSPRINGHSANGVPVQMRMTLNNGEVKSSARTAAH